MKTQNPSLQQFKPPRYFKLSQSDVDSYVDPKRNIIILGYKFTNTENPYTIKFNKKCGGYELVSEEDFERMTLFFEMMNEQRHKSSTG